MDKDAMISLVIPVYNEEANLPHLIERLRSVMQKMGKRYEIIFVDDGSWDNTLSILKSFLVYPEIRVQRQIVEQHAPGLSPVNESEAPSEMPYTLPNPRIHLAERFLPASRLVNLGLVLEGVCKSHGSQVHHLTPGESLGEESQDSVPRHPDCIDWQSVKERKPFHRCPIHH